jgi:hypothetical protein
MICIRSALDAMSSSGHGVQPGSSQGSKPCIGMLSRDTLYQIFRHVPFEDRCIAEASCALTQLGRSSAFQGSHTQFLPASL